MYSIITALVSPKNTSKHCALRNDGREENSLVSRIEAQFSTDVAKRVQITMNKSLEKVDYSTGAPNYICSETIEHKGNADLNAARNIGLRFFARYYQKPRLEVAHTGFTCYPSSQFGIWHGGSVRVSGSTHAFSTCLDYPFCIVVASPRGY